MRRVTHLVSRAVVLGTIVAGLYGCGNSENTDNPRKGVLAIAADESFSPVVDALTKGYEGIYPDVDFKVTYKPEQEAILAFLQDSVRLVFVARELSDKEKEVIVKRQGNYRVQHIATDGIALITSRSNRDSLITMDKLREIFEGKVTDWSQLSASHSGGEKITLVFDDVNSSNLRYIMEQFGLKDITQLRLRSAKSNQEVIEYVKKDPSAIGFIGVNWISDGDEALTHELSKGLRVLGVSSEKNPASARDYAQPFQRDLSQGKYPLARKLYLLSNDGNASLAGGLMTYIARDVGGLIIQKMGLIPAIPYPRVVEIRKE